MASHRIKIDHDPTAVALTNSQGGDMAVSVSLSSDECEPSILTFSRTCGETVKQKGRDLSFSYACMLICFAQMMLIYCCDLK